MKKEGGKDFEYTIHNGVNISFNSSNPQEGAERMKVWKREGAPETVYAKSFRNYADGSTPISIPISNNPISCIGCTGQQPVPDTNTSKNTFLKPRYIETELAFEESTAMGRGIPCR
jgi:hypothetical protein